MTMTVTIQIDGAMPMHVKLPGCPRVDELIAFTSPTGRRQVRVRAVQWTVDGETVLYCDEVAA